MKGIKSIIRVIIFKVTNSLFFKLLFVTLLATRLVAMADDEDEGKLSGPTLLNRIATILLSIYFICYLLYESYNFTSRNFISAAIYEYILFWVTCQHLAYFILALLNSCKNSESSSSLLPTIFTGLTFPLSQVSAKE